MSGVADERCTCIPYIRASLRYIAVQCLYNLVIYYGYYWLDAIATSIAKMYGQHQHPHKFMVWCHLSRIACELLHPAPPQSCYIQLYHTSCIVYAIRQFMHAGITAYFGSYVLSNDYSTVKRWQPVQCRIQYVGIIRVLCVRTATVYKHYTQYSCQYYIIKINKQFNQHSLQTLNQRISSSIHCLGCFRQKN